MTHQRSPSSPSRWAAAALICYNCLLVLPSLVSGQCIDPDAPTHSNAVLLRVHWVGYPKQIPRAEFDRAARDLRTAYNRLSENECDWLHRSITSIQVAEIEMDRDLPDNEEQAYETIFAIEYECIGEACEQEDVLMSQVDGFVDRKRARRQQRKLKGGGGGSGGEGKPPPPPPPPQGEDDRNTNDLQEPDPIDECACPNPDATNDAPTLRRVLRRYQNRVSDNRDPLLGRPQHILEVAETECFDRSLEFDSELLVDVDLEWSATPTDPNEPIVITQDEEDILAASFMSSINYMEEVECNPSRMVQILRTDATLDGGTSTRARRLGGDDGRVLSVQTGTNKRGLQVLTVRFLFFVTGICYGCVNQEQLYNDAVDSIYRYLSGRRVRGLRSRLSQNEANVRVALQRDTLSTRRLQPSDTEPPMCYCAILDGNGQPPEVEFFDSFQSTLQQEVEAGRIKSLGPVRDVRPRKQQQ